MILLIGGPARCGKSTLSKRIEGGYGITPISLDAFKHALVSVASERIKKDLIPSTSHIECSLEEWLGDLRKRDLILWRGFKEYVVSGCMNNDNTLAEGCIWPDYIADLKVEHRAVFLVDTSENQAERLIKASADNSTYNNWQKEKSEEWIRGWAKYNIERSKLLKKLAKQYGYPVFDIADHGFDYAQSLAIKYLLADFKHKAID